jgi:hypothetical protein
MIAHLRCINASPAWILTSVLACIAPASPGNAQTLIQSAAEFDSAPADEQRLLLDGLASHRRSLPPQELAVVLATALAHPDPQLKRRALMVVASRAGAVRVSVRDELRTRWHSERPVLINLTQPVWELLQDGDEDVRRAAIEAAASLEFDLENPTARVNAALMQRLGEIYAKEISASVRARIVDIMSVDCSGSIQPLVLMTAVQESDPGVLQYAVPGVANCQSVEVLSRLVQLLTHERVSVRLAVAHALVRFGLLATPYLTEIEQAASAEPDAIVRKTLLAAAGTISARK